MQMYDAGEKMGDMPEMAIGKSKDKKYYPHLDLDSNQFPMIKDMKVGEKCMLTIEVKPTRFSTNEAEGKEAKSSMCMEVMRIGMSDDQSEGMGKDEKMNKMVDKMYPEKKDKKMEDMKK